MIHLQIRIHLRLQFLVLQRKYLKFCCLLNHNISSLVNNVLISHPCTVLRRQCQIHQLAYRRHLTPFTLIPVIGQIVTKDVFY